MPSTMIHIRIDEELKEDATKALAAMGLTLSDAVRILPTYQGSDRTTLTV